MGVRIQGMGWVTPLGCGLDEVWARLMAGDRAEVKPLANPETGRVHRYVPVPPKLVEALGRNPRLRRSSPLSYFAATAGLAALANGGLTLEAARQARVAVIFAVASGSVLYTRRFYEQVTKEGAQAASPMLFPETVYNAPASHLCALLGIDGASYTVVGDSSVGLAALGMAEQLLDLGEADYCVVAATEEMDWVLCEGYRDWRFTGADSLLRLYETPARGTILGEGAAALLLSRDGPGIEVQAVHPGVPFVKRADAAAATERVVRELGPVDCVVGSANGSFMDAGEADVLRRHLPQTPLTCPKVAWGETLGAGALLQVITAAEALRRGELPPVGDAGAGAPEGLVREPRSGLSLQSSLVLATGLNQQASGAILTRSGT